MRGFFCGHDYGSRYNSYACVVVVVVCVKLNDVVVEVVATMSLKLWQDVTFTKWHHYNSNDVP